MATRCIFSTGNIMTAGAGVIRKPTMEKSNTELVNSLRENLKASSSLPTVSPTSVNGNGNGATNGTARKRKSVDEWTREEDGVLYIPTMVADAPKLAEEREEYDVTVKLFYLPGASTTARPAHTAEAVRLVCEELGASNLDLLIISFPSISFDADDSDPSDPAEVAEWVEAYRTLESLHDAGTITRLGISEFDTTRLSQFLPLTRIKPSVNQINVRDCCVVPKPLIIYAKQEGIELLTHNECTDILPAKTLRGVVEEFGILDDRNLVPQWVVKYTAIIRSRGVIENKGYMAMAELH